MPGIAGIISSTASVEHEESVRRMVATMRHQPASDEGTLSLPHLGVYAGWVSHAGSYAAKQSSVVGNHGTRLLFSGECYSPDMGSPTRPGTVEKSLLSRYEVEGDGLIASLNGSFSGLLVDPMRKRALLFNDRFGTERIYCIEKDGVTYFASEAKALLRVLPELRAFDETGVVQFLTFGCTLDGHTLFRNLRVLPGGSLLIFAEGARPSRTRYFTPSEWECQPSLDDATFESRFAETFNRVLPGYLGSDAPLGISLTGGLDTRMIMACLPRSMQQQPIAYTYAAQAGDTLDLKIGRRVARSRGIAHQALRIGSDFLSDYGQHVDRTVFVTDGCAGALGAHEIYLSEHARRLATVRLTGNFGSEVLRSMSTFKPLDTPGDMFDAGLAPLLGNMAAQIQQRSVHPVTHAAFQEIPWHIFGTVAAGRSQLTIRTPYMDNEIVKLAYQAPTHMRRTPEPALRLIHDNDAALAAIPTDRGLAWGQGSMTRLARRLVCEVTFKLDYWHKEGLPHGLSGIDPAMGVLSSLGVLGLHKFLPYRVWFRRELAPYVAAVVSDGRTHRMPFWNPRFLDSVVSEHVSGRRNRLREIHTIITLEAVQRMLMESATQ